MTWAPLLDGNSAARAREAIDAVARALREPDPAWRVGASLANGDAGLAVLYAYLGDGELALALAERAIDAVAAVPMAPSLHHGFVGIAWATEHLIGRVLEPGDDPNAAIDEALLDVLRRPADEVDVMNGVAGIAVYALERAPRPASRELLELVVTQLAARAERTATGIAWRTPAALVDRETRDALGDAVYNLGLAHGAPGVIVTLAACVEVGIAGAAELLDGAVRWLLAQQLPRGGFPDLATVSVPARLGWCYGDVSVATALVLAGRTGRDEWTRAGMALAHAAAGRADDTTGVRDACLCHGAAGLGLMFARLAHASGDARLAIAATRWFERALDLRGDDAVGGFAPFVVDRSLALGDAAVGLLTGAAGVALALHAAITSVEPAWDRAWLLSVR